MELVGIYEKWEFKRISENKRVFVSICEIFEYMNEYSYECVFICFLCANGHKFSVIPENSILKNGKKW